MNARKKAFFLLGLVIVFSVAGSGFIALDVSSRNMKWSIADMLLEEEELRADAIAATLDNDFAILATIASFPGMQTMDWETIRPLLLNFMPLFHANDFVLVTPDGISRTIQSGAAFDAGSSACFRLALAGERNVEIVYIDDGPFSRLEMLLATPVYPDSQNSAPVSGVLIAKKDLPSVIMEGSYFAHFSYVLNTEGTVIAHPWREWTMGDINFLNMAQRYPEYKDLSEMWKVAIGPGAINRGIISYDQNKTKMLEFFVRVRGYPWVLFTPVKEAEINRDILSFQTTLALIILGFLIVGLGSVFFVVSRYVPDPK